MPMQMQGRVLCVYVRHGACRMAIACVGLRVRVDLLFLLPLLSHSIPTLTDHHASDNLPAGPVHQDAGLQVCRSAVCSLQSVLGSDQDSLQTFTVVAAGLSALLALVHTSRQPNSRTIPSSAGSSQMYCNRPKSNLRYSRSRVASVLN